MGAPHKARGMDKGKVKKVWVVIGNTDNTEGKGSPVYIAFTPSESGARRIAKGHGARSTPAQVEEIEVFWIKGRWYGPVTIDTPGDGDLLRDRRLDVLVRARELGMTDDELALLGEGDQ